MCSETEIINSYERTVCAVAQSGIIRYLPSQECRCTVGFRPAIFCRSDQPYLLIALAHCGKFWFQQPFDCRAVCSLLPSVYLSVGKSDCTHPSVIIGLYLKLLIQNLLEKKSRKFFLQNIALWIWNRFMFYLSNFILFKCVYLTTPSVAKIIQRWWRMNEYGALVEWYCQGKIQVRGEKTFCLPNPTWTDLGSNPSARGEASVFPPNCGTVPLFNA